jgi:hypothetical protein
MAMFAINRGTRRASRRLESSADIFESLPSIGMIGLVENSHGLQVWIEQMMVDEGQTPRLSALDPPLTLRGLRP